VFVMCSEGEPCEEPSHLTEHPTALANHLRYICDGASFLPTAFLVYRL